MTREEIAEYIDRGACFYVDLFGRAEHMEKVEREHYSFVRPRGGVYGISFVYDLKLDGLPVGELLEQAREIRALGMPVWVGLTDSDRVFRACTGRERPEPGREPGMDDEVYMYTLAEPEEMAGPQVTEAGSQAEFAEWAGVVNGVLSGGREDLHPVYHYPLCRDGLLRCYFLRDTEGRVVSAAALAVDGGSVSLEFVATLPEHRRKGYSGALCRRAVRDAFGGGADIVTVRAVDGIAAKLYESVGFERY